MEGIRNKLPMLKRTIPALIIAVTVFGILGIGNCIKVARADMGGGSSDFSVLLSYYDDPKWVTFLDNVAFQYNYPLTNYGGINKYELTKTISNYTSPSGYEIIFVDVGETRFSASSSCNDRGSFKLMFKGQLDDSKWADVTYGYAQDSTDNCGELTTNRPPVSVSIPSGIKNFKIDVDVDTSSYDDGVRAYVTCRVLIAKPKAAASLGDLNTTLTSINSHLTDLINTISTGNTSLNSRQTEIRDRIQTLADNVNSLVNTYNSKMNSEISELQGIKGELIKMSGDKVPPKLSLAWGDGAVVTDALSKNLRVWATDNTGVSQMKINGGAWIPYSDNVNIPLTIGLNEITVFVRDAAGNVAQEKTVMMRY